MTNSSSGGGGFDPRFNPAFQPGYKPEMHGQQPQPSAPMPNLDLPPATGAPGRGEGHGEGWRDDPRLTDAQPTDAQPTDSQPTDSRAGDPRPGDSHRDRAPRVDGDQRWEEGDSHRLEDAHYGEEEVPLSHRFDAYLIALWAVSVAFVAGGLAVVGYISERLDKLTLTDGGNGFDYYLLQVYTIAAPLLVLLGLATAVGTLFLLAARLGRNRAR